MDIPLNITLALIIVALGAVVTIAKWFKAPETTDTYGRPPHPDNNDVMLPLWANRWVYDHNMKQIIPALFVEGEWYNCDGEPVPDEITQHWQEMYSPVAQRTVWLCIAILILGTAFVVLSGGPQ